MLLRRWHLNLSLSILVLAITAAGFLSLPSLFHDPAGVVHEGEAVGTMARAHFEVS